MGLYSLNEWRLSRLKPSDLVIYAYSSFTASWGAGPLLKEAFEKQCQCQIEIRDADDGRLLIQRLKLEGAHTGADVIVGLNQWDVDEAVENLSFLPVPWQPSSSSWESFSQSLALPPFLMPFDWGLLTVNTRQSSAAAGAKDLPSLLALLPPKSLALQDPRTSAPGLTVFLWLVQTLGEEEAFSYLRQLKQKVFTIAPSWSLSYGFFQKGQAEAVFSYVTSPIYHQQEEKDFNYLALELKEGLALHVELTGVLSTCRHCDRAKDFVRFLMTPEAQEILMKKNYMLPVDSAVAQKEPWRSVAQLKRTPLRPVSRAEKKRLLARWSAWAREK